MNLKKDCIFCQIIDGEKTAHKIYEDEHFIAILDAYPATEGHALVITKNHHPELLDLPEKELKHAMRVIQKVADGVCEAVDADGFNIHQSNNPVAGQEIFHIHFHIIPRFHGDNIEFKMNKEELDSEKAKSLKDKIKKYMG